MRPVSRRQINACIDILESLVDHCGVFLAQRLTGGNSDDLGQLVRRRSNIAILRVNSNDIAVFANHLRLTHSDLSSLLSSGGRLNAFMTELDCSAFPVIPCADMIISLSVSPLATKRLHHSLGRSTLCPDIRALYGRFWTGLKGYAFDRNILGCSVLGNSLRFLGIHIRTRPRLRLLVGHTRNLIVPIFLLALDSLSRLNSLLTEELAKIFWRVAQSRISGTLQLL